MRKHALGNIVHCLLSFDNRESLAGKEKTPSITSNANHFELHSSLTGRLWRDAPCRHQPGSVVIACRLHSDTILLATFDMASISQRSLGSEELRPLAIERHSSPSVVSLNGHFAPVSGAGTPSKEQYEHGVQVINEDKEFR